VNYCAGGGGGAYNNGVSTGTRGGNGGNNTAGNGGKFPGSNGGNARNGSGSGGGGGGPSNPGGGTFVGGNGGSGIVIIKFKNVPEQDGNERKKITLKCNQNQLNRLVYDFTPYNDLTSWKKYAKDNGFNYKFSWWNNDRIWEFLSGDYATHTHSRGFIELELNNDYNYVIIEFSIPDATNIGVNNATAYVNLFMYDKDSHIQKDLDIDYNEANKNQRKATWWHRDYKDMPLKFESTYTKNQAIRIVEYEASISKNIKITLLKREVTYLVNIPINTYVSINNGKTEILNQGTYNIIMNPEKSKIINIATGAQFGSLYNNNADGELIFKYIINKSLSQIHDLSTTFTGTQNKISIADEKYYLGTKIINKIIKYRIYIYKKYSVNHSFTLYAGNRLLTNGTDYITSGSNQEAGVFTINLYNFYITINKEISGAIYLKSDNSIFYIDETIRTTFNNRTDAQFLTNVNNLINTGTTTLTRLNNMFGVKEATDTKATAEGKLITYQIIHPLNSHAQITIDYKSNPVSRTALNNLATTYNNISRYSPRESGYITPILNANFRDILNSTPTDIQEYISYEFPSPPTDTQITPDNRTTIFNINSNATKYVYFKKKAMANTNMFS